MNNPADTLAALAECIAAIQREETDAGKMIGYRAGHVLLERFAAAIASLKGEAAPVAWAAVKFHDGLPDKIDGSKEYIEQHCKYYGGDLPMRPRPLIYGDTTPPAPQAVGEALREVKLRLHFLGMPGEPMWNAGSEDAPRWVPDWRFEIDLIEHALHGSPRKFATRPTDTRRRIETEANPTPSPAPQGGGERFAMESLPVNAPMQHPERNVAEQAYTQTAFNYEANPIGCRDWTIYWRGWWHRAVINDLATPPAQQPKDAAETHKATCNLRYPATLGTGDDKCDCASAQQPGEVGEDIAELRRNYDGAKRWLFALAMEQGGSVTVSRQTLYRMRPDDKLTMMESPSGDAYRLTAALAPKEKGNG